MNALLATAAFWLAAAALALELLLARMFAVSQWHHLAFMIISTALLGFAAGGALLNLLRRWTARDLSEWVGPLHLHICLLAFPPVSIFVIWLLNRLPLDFFRIPFETVQVVYLLISYLLLALPFCICGGVIALAYALAGKRTGRMYAAAMLGSALGALLPWGLLPLLGLQRSLWLTAALPLAMVFSLMGGLLGGARAKGPTTKPDTIGKGKGLGLLGTYGIVLMAVAALFLNPADQKLIVPSPYKALSQLRQRPQTVVEDIVHDLRGAIQMATDPSWRYAPGLSLTYAGGLPKQKAMFTDGDRPLTLYRRSPPADSWEFAHHMLPCAGYRLNPSAKRALLILASGGAAPACAMDAGVETIELSSAHATVTRILADHYGLIPRYPPPRSLLADPSPSYDIIHVEAWGSSLLGVNALDQTHWLTREAFEAYLQNLSSQGILILGRKLLLPPADSLRLWATAYEALARHGLASPAQHLLMLRNWDLFTLIVSLRPLDSAALAPLLDWARRLNFDWIYAPAKIDIQANRFSRFAQPYHHQGLRDLAAAYQEGRPQTVFDRYPLDVAPQGDNRPYPNRVIKWRGLKQLHEMKGGRIYGLLLSAESVVWVLLAETLLIGMVLLALPMAEQPGRGRTASWPMLLYCGGLGLGFICFELYLIRQLTRLFDAPIISLALVLSVLLAVSAAGGLLADRMRTHRLRLLLVLVIGCLGLYAWCLPLVVDGLLPLSAAAQYVGAGLVMLPAILLGLPFPLGLRLLGQRDYLRNLGWLSNGVTSVAGAVVAAQAALLFGLHSIILLAIGGYGLALAVVSRHRNHA
jgi:hypothetical protein